MWKILSFLLQQSAGGSAEGSAEPRFCLIGRSLVWWVWYDILMNTFLFQFLTRGESIFRQEWELDEDKIRSGLTITSHPALLPYVARFFTDTGHNVSLHYEVRFKSCNNLTNQFSVYFHFFCRFRIHTTTTWNWSNKIYPVSQNSCKLLEPKWPNMQI